MRQIRNEKPRWLQVASPTHHRQSGTQQQRHVFSFNLALDARSRNGLVNQWACINPMDENIDSQENEQTQISLSETKVTIKTATKRKKRRHQIVRMCTSAFVSWIMCTSAFEPIWNGAILQIYLYHSQGIFNLDWMRNNLYMCAQSDIQ